MPASKAIVLTKILMPRGRRKRCACDSASDGTGRDGEHVDDEAQRAARAAGGVVAIREVGRDVQLHPVTPTSPSSQPLMTRPAPTWKSKVCCRFQDESNSSPVL